MTRITISSGTPMFGMVGRSPLIFILLTVIILTMVTNASSLVHNFPVVVMFAVTYNCGAYGAGSYSSADPCTTTSTQASSGSTTTSGLSDTGTSIYIGVGTGILLILIAVAILLRARKKTRR